MYKTYIVVVRVGVSDLHRRDVESISGLVIPADKPIHTGVCERLHLNKPDPGVEVYELDEFITAINDQDRDNLTDSWVSYVYKEIK